jgi:hypothetical protein
VVGVRVGCQICCCVGNAVGGEVGQVARITTYFYTVTKVVFWAPPLGTGAHKFTPTKGRN